MHIEAKLENLLHAARREALRISSAVGAQNSSESLDQGSLEASPSNAQSPDWPVRFLYALILARFCQSRTSLSIKSFQSLDHNVKFDEVLECFSELDSIFHTTFFVESLPSRHDFEQAFLQSLKHELLTQLESPSISDLSLLFEILFAGPRAKLDGIFYTPIQVVRHMVVDSLSDPKFDIRHAAVLDPGCGSGIFLIEAFRFLTDRFGKNDFDLQLLLIQETLCGIDRDPLACDVTKILLLLALVEGKQLSLVSKLEIGDVQPRIVTGNSLLEPDQLKALHTSSPETANSLNPIAIHEYFPDVMRRSGFDCIIGNPPYGLARGLQISDVENKYLKQVYAVYRRGKLNKYLLFMARAYQLLRPNGIMNFIVPNSWLGIQSGAAMRELFIGDGALEKITVFRQPVFDTPSVEAVLTSVRKGAGHDHLTIRHVDQDPSMTVSEFELPYSTCRRMPEMIIPVNWSLQSSKIMQHIISNSLPLGSPNTGFKPMIALQAYARGKGKPAQSAEQVKQHVFHGNQQLDESYYPYLQGSDILRYSFDWSGDYLSYGPWLAEPQRIERFSGPRIVIREITNPAPYCINACFIDQTYLYNKSVLHILPFGKGSPKRLWALLAIFNSSFASFVLSNQGKKTNRNLFPKIVNRDLKDFPLPRCFDSFVDALADLSQQISRRSKQFEADNLRSLWRSSQSQGQSKSLIALQEQLDALVFECFNLNADHIAIISKSLSA